MALVAAPQASAATVSFANGLIGVLASDEQLPPGVSIGDTHEINHTPGLDGEPEASSEALVIDFGQEVWSVSASLAAFSDDEGGCIEVGRYTTFDASGEQILTAIFPAPGPVEVQDLEDRPLRFIAFSAEPYADFCELAGDSSDYTIQSISYTPLGEEGPLVLTAFNVVPENLYAYDIYEPFVDEEGYLISPDGNRLVNPVNPVIVIDTTTCEGGTGTGSGGECVVKLGDQLTTTFANAGDISGTLELASIQTIVDNRPACAVPATGVPQPLTLADYPATDGGYLTIPAHLCGIPNPDTGTPEFVVVDLISDLIVESSVIFHEVTNPANTAFACKSPAEIAGSGNPAELRSRQPVLGWLPKDGEIPVLDRTGVAVNVIENLTSGCGSYRGSTGRMSYILYNLRHRPGTNYVPIIAADIAQLATTLNQSDPCVSQGALTSVERSHLDKVSRHFARAEYPRAKQELIIFRQILLDRRELVREFPACFYDARQTPPVVFVREGQDPGEGVKPRNFRGDLISQSDHILYMMETMLGVLTPAIP